MSYIADTLIQLPPETDAAFNIRVQTYITDQQYYFEQVGGTFPASNVPGGSDFLGYPPICASHEEMVWDVTSGQMVRSVTFCYENSYYYKFLGTDPVLPPPSPLPVSGDMAIFGSTYGLIDSGLSFSIPDMNFTNLGLATANGMAVEYSQLVALAAGVVTSVNGVLPVLGNVSLDTDDIPVGVTNLYTTNPITLAYVLTGFVAGGAGPITAADTFLSALESLQFQINTIAVPTLTQNQIAFGDAANEMTSSANLTWIEATRILTITGTIGLVLDNSANVFYVAQGNVGFWYTGTASTGLLAHQGFGIDFKAGNVYTMGDVGITNNTHIEVDDVAQTITLQEVNGVIVADLASVATRLVTVTSAGLLTGASVAANILTFLATPSSVNLAAAVTDETGTGLLVFGTSPTFKTSIILNNPADTFAYNIIPAAIAANRDINLPLLTGVDTFAVLDLSQIFTNKTIDGANNTISNAVNISAEQSSTPVTDNGESNLNSGIRYYVFIQLPTTEKFYTITGIEWKNGTVVNGNIFSGVEAVDANPPTLASTMLVATGQPVAQAGVSSVQRVSIIGGGAMIPGGTILGVWIGTGSGTGTFRHQTGLASQNTEKSGFTFSVDYPNGNSTTWGANTIYKYIKLYYKGFS